GARARARRRARHHRAHGRGRGRRAPRARAPRARRARRRRARPPLRSKGESAMDRREVRSSSAPAPIGPYSQAVASDGWLFCSGQIALDGAGALVGAGDAAAEAEQACSNLLAVLREAGCEPEAIVKTTLFLV